MIKLYLIAPGVTSSHLHKGGDADLGTLAFGAFVSQVEKMPCHIGCIDSINGLGVNFILSYDSPLSQGTHQRPYSCSTTR